ncbi:multidrug ABC transporter [Desulfosarcina ovata subsp. sediminis]|uniref:Multidrug ABC transporter n=1 Tax=Desulfosarcina ovata subsp. sediminis TaxID=885957 RepID=A0A5K7ZIP1_9BACT|nr:efflux RND transporter permease subunit [Desulfosarcina ovata]BBO82098.1 multidrug ABC transporter [Desulfosarcina ovata subsp. sediminis]
MTFISLVIRRWLIFALLVIALPIVAGTVAYQTLPKEGEPEISAPVAIVVTLFPGASPSEVESLVTNPIEEELSDLKDVEEMRSNSAEGVSVVVIDFEAEADLERSLQKVREKVSDARKELPDQAEDPEVNEVSFSDIPIMIASVVGDIDPVKLRRLTERVADEIELMPEILAADVAGGLVREIQIYLDPQRINQYGLTILDVFDAVKQSDINIPGGQVNLEGRRLLLRTLTEIKHVPDYAKVPLVRQGDRVVFLGDVGTVVDGHSEDVSYSRVGGVNSASIAVKKRSGANILETTYKVRDKLKELEATFPAGVTTTITAEKAKFIKQGFDQMNNSAVVGLIIVVVVLYFAMGLRNSVITSLSIPLSLLLTFVFLKVFGLSNNDMVRFALVLCIGMLVDNAIIVVENVYHHFQLGKDRITAVIDGTSEIAMPVISATLTTMAAFLPMLLMTGVTGEYMGFLPKTVTIALSASLVIALIANPLILSRFMKQTVKAGQIVKPEEDLKQLKRLYVRVVSWSLNHRFQVVCLIVLSLAMAVGLVALKLVKIEMFPDADFDYIYITVETPRGTDVDVTDAVARQVEQLVAAHVPEAVQTVATVGQQGQSAYEFSVGTGIDSHFAEITVELQDGKEVARASHRQIQERLRPYLQKIPGADIRFRAIQWGPPTAAPVLIKIIGPEIPELRRLTAQTRRIMEDVAGVVDIKDDFSDAAPELRVSVDRARSAAMGISLEALAYTLRGATAGLEIREFRDERDVSKKYDLKVRFSPESRTRPSMLDDVKVRADTGELVPLSTIAEFSQGSGLNGIRHSDRRRIVRLSANNRGRSAVEITQELIEKLDRLDLPAGYRFDYSGEYEETAESFESLGLAYIVAAILIFTLLVSQFDSLAQPFAILTSLPLSIVGAMVGLYATGNNFSIMSFIGLVGLSGIVVNDSIVLVDCINRMRMKSLDLFEAIVAGGQQRLRPIISTTVSTVGGILTLTITDELWEGLGVVIIFGICFATVLTLVVVPVMYSLFEGARYSIVSAFRGPRWTEAPKGQSYFFSRRRYARLVFVLLMAGQLAVLAAGIAAFAPPTITTIANTPFQAPSTLKLVIEIIVFGLEMLLKAAGLLAVLLLPTWVGLVYVMAKRSREGYYVDITPQGVFIGTPADRFFIEKDAITAVKAARFFPAIPSISIYSGRRRIIVRKLIKAGGAPEKKPLKAWLLARPPQRAAIREGMHDLKRALDALVTS